MSSQVQEGLETSIDNFVFRQCPAEFKLKVTNSDNEIPSWIKFIDSLPKKSSLIQISHKRGIVFFPHYKKGALGYAPIKNLAEAENLSAEFLSFSDDESFISAICLDPSEDFLYVAKGSKMIYAVDLTSEDKRPFYKVKQRLEDVAIECVVSENHEIFVLLQNGNLFNFTRISSQSPPALNQIELFISEIVNGPISCISQIRNDLMAVGSKEKSEIYLINLEQVDVTFKTISVPFEELGCGSIGISSIFLFKDENNLLFSCYPENPETDDVPLLLLENISNEAEMKFSFFFDPCASRPPRQNQFYFQTLPISKWADNMVDLVVVGNYASPDLGICGRLEVGGEFQTFIIDNDEGLAQLPFINGEVTYPLGLALDLSSKTFLDNLKDPEAETHPPAPIIWVLTNTAHLCPFSMVKIDETEPFSFMKQVPVIEFSPASKSFEEISSDELKSFSESEFETESEEEEPQTPPQKTLVPAVVASSTPQTPSKVPLQHLASLQKSAEIKPIESSTSAGMFSFKPAAVVTESAKPTPNKPVSVPVTSQPAVKPANQTAAVKPVVKAQPEPEPILVKKEEKMETMNVSSYQNILLAEVAATHAAMQEDLFSLKQLSLKNSLLLRQNSQKYFNSLESLESYAVSLEKLLASSDKVFLVVKDRLDELKLDLKELMVKMKQVKSAWNRIKQDNKINWDSRVRALSISSQELFERIDRLRNFLSNPVEASKYRATLQSFIDSTQEKLQLLMAHLSNLFVCQKEDVSTSLFSDFGGLSLSPSLSSESLLDQLGVLSLEGSRESMSDSRTKTEKRNKSLLNAVKARGSRLLIPQKFTPAPAIDATKHLKLTAEDESLISSFISAINLTEEVPEFAETAIFAKLSLEDKDTSAAAADKPVASPVAADKSAAATKAFEFKPATIQSKAFEFKPAFVETKPSFEFKPAPVEAKPFEFKAPAFTSESKLLEFKPVTQSAPSFEFNPATVETKPFEFKLPEAKPAESKPTPSPGLFSFSSVNSDKPQSATVPTSATFSFKPIETKDTAASSPSLSIKSETPSGSVKSETSSTSETANVSAKSNILSDSAKYDTSESKETPKIPSIFTIASKPAATEHESVLKKESPLPTFDSLNFGSDVNEEKSEIVKPFPSIFGVKPVEKKESATKAESAKSESTTFFSFSSPSISEKKDEPVTSSVPVQGFSFSFKSEGSAESVTENDAEKAKEPVSNSIKEVNKSPAEETDNSPVNEPEKESTPETSQSLTTAPSSTPAAAPTFSFSFASNADKSPVQSAASGFSIASKPTFGTTTAPATSAPVFGSTSLLASAPVFGSTSLPTANAPVFGSTSLPTANAPVFGSTSIPSVTSFGSVPPAFGQTSFPSAGFNTNVPVPATPAGSSGFAAFAAASNQGATGFSAFAAPQSGTGNGLTFASFLPADKDKKKDQQQQQGSGGAPSSFSFTGFRE